MNIRIKKNTKSNVSVGVLQGIIFLKIICNYTSFILVSNKCNNTKFLKFQNYIYTRIMLIKHRRNLWTVNNRRFEGKNKFSSLKALRQPLLYTHYTYTRIHVLYYKSTSYGYYCCWDHFFFTYSPISHVTHAVYCKNFIGLLCRKQK